jgi:hypothetical protein
VYNISAIVFEECAIDFNTVDWALLYMVSLVGACISTFPSMALGTSIVPITQ